MYHLCCSHTHYRNFHFLFLRSINVHHQCCHCFRLYLQPESVLGGIYAVQKIRFVYLNRTVSCSFEQTFDFKHFCAHSAAIFNHHTTVVVLWSVVLTASLILHFVCIKSLTNYRIEKSVKFELYIPVFDRYVKKKLPARADISLRQCFLITSEMFVALLVVFLCAISLFYCIQNLLFLDNVVLHVFEVVSMQLYH